MELLFNLSLLGLVVVGLLMTLLILMQKPKQEGLGAAFGGGMTNDMFGAHTVTVLQKGTVWLAVAFFVLTAVVAWSAVRLGQGEADEPAGADYDSLDQAAFVEDQPAQDPVAAPAAEEDSPEPTPTETEATASTEAVSAEQAPEESITPTAEATGDEADVSIDELPSPDNTTAPADETPAPDDAEVSTAA